jgi:hypothetical protein
MNFWMHSYAKISRISLYSLCTVDVITPTRHCYRPTQHSWMSSSISVIAFTDDCSLWNYTRWHIYQGKQYSIVKKIAGEQSILEDAAHVFTTVRLILYCSTSQRWQRLWTPVCWCSTNTFRSRSNKTMILSVSAGTSNLVANYILNWYCVLSTLNCRLLLNWTLIDYTVTSKIPTKVTMRLQCWLSQLPLHVWSLLMEPKLLIHWSETPVVSSLLSNRSNAIHIRRRWQTISTSVIAIATVSSNLNAKPVNIAAVTGQNVTFSLRPEIVEGEFVGTITN